MCVYSSLLNGPIELKVRPKVLCQQNERLDSRGRFSISGMSCRRVHVSNDGTMQVTPAVLLRLGQEPAVHHLLKGMLAFFVW